MSPEEQSPKPESGKSSTDYDELMREAQAESGGQGGSEQPTAKDSAIEAMIDQRTAEFRAKNPRATEEEVAAMRASLGDRTRRLVETTVDQGDQFLAEEYEGNVRYWEQRLADGKLTEREEAEARSNLEYFQREAQAARGRAEGKPQGTGDIDVEASRAKVQRMRRV